MIKATTLFAH